MIGTMTENVLERFDFDGAAKVYASMKWTWAHIGSHRSPCAQELRLQAQDLLSRVEILVHRYRSEGESNHTYIGTCGLYAFGSYTKDKGCRLDLRFVPFDATAYSFDFEN